MITNENKLFLKEYFEIDCDSYTEKELSSILDKLIQLLEDNIQEKKINILKSIKNIVTNISKTDNN